MTRRMGLGLIGMLGVVVPGQGSTVCVTSVYEGFLKDDTVRSCQLVILSK